MLNVTMIRAGKAPVKKTLPPGSSVQDALNSADIDFSRSTLFLSRDGRRDSTSLGYALRDGDTIVVNKNNEGGAA
tara:strand:+ start:557 stop:781 length:225 start_codon:yes stop_codon:yes gene_type:complete